VVLRPFKISQYPITNAQYRKFVDAGGYGESGYWTKIGWSWRNRKNWTKAEHMDDPYWGSDNKPVVGVTWFEAVAYANWLSQHLGSTFRLPTEAEWEYAARGAGGFSYPWGNDWEDNVANVQEIGLRGPTAVGAFPDGASSFGCFDMAGNVWEWCQSRYKDYPYEYDDGREALNKDGTRILRGGAYNGGTALARSTYRMWRQPFFRSRYIGFRLIQVIETE
jgi:formylglycine-generating enzyme required for sulfatase activity